MNLSSLQSLAWTKLDDNGTSYPAANVTSAINEGLRLFCLLTLCLEKTATFALNPAGATGTWYQISSQFSDWLLPRRVVNSQGLRLRPARLRDLDALASNWQYTRGLPSRYSQKGFDLLTVFPQPPVQDYLTVTYAQVPAPLVNGTDAPAIPEASGFALSNYAAYALRQPEGGQQFSKFLSYFNEFMDEAQRVQKLMKARNMDLGYEKPPFELENFDRSQLMRWGSVNR